MKEAHIFRHQEEGGKCIVLFKCPHCEEDSWTEGLYHAEVELDGSYCWSCRRCHRLVHIRRDKVARNKWWWE